jgi:hypothetical protein
VHVLVPYVRHGVQSRAVHDLSAPQGDKMDVGSDCAETDPGEGKSLVVESPQASPSATLPGSCYFD